MAFASSPDLTLAPSELGLTGLETYFWIDDSPEPVSATASAAGFTVEAEASPSQFIWDFGDGNELVTGHAGRPWSRSAPGNIDHVYESRGTFDISVDIVWSARWRQGGGPWQPLGLFTTSDAETYPVRQIQSRLVSDE